MEPKSASPAVIPREASQQADYAREGPAQNTSKFDERHESCQTGDASKTLTNNNNNKAGPFTNNKLL